MPLSDLFAELAGVAPYPKGVVEVPERVPGTTFFPGGSGLWRVDPDLPAQPVGGVMVLGHNYDSEAGFARTFGRGTEVEVTDAGELRVHTATFRGLIKLFTSVSVPWERCFFTNAFMGLREGDESTGRFPGSRDSEFVDRCGAFLCRQLSIQRPAVVLTLGKWVPAFLARRSKQLTPWLDRDTFAKLDEVRGNPVHIGPVVHGVEFADCLGAAPPCTVVALTHPSCRPGNIHRRRFRTEDGHALEGHEAEVAMVREAMLKSPLREQ